MGADSSLFALKSKKYYYFDRDYNLRAHDYAADIHIEDWELQTDLHEEMKNQWLCNSDMVFYLKDNIKYWEEFRAFYGREDDDEHRIVWSKRLINFVNAHPDDHFRVVTESHVDYDDLTNEFEEVPELDMEI